MLRNEDELALSKRFESVRGKTLTKNWHYSRMIMYEHKIFSRRYSLFRCYNSSLTGTYRHQKCHASFRSHSQEDEPHWRIPALYVCPASLSPHATWVFLWMIHCLKGHFRLFELGLYEVLINCQCISCSRWWSACPRFGQAERTTSMEAKQWPAVHMVSSKTYFSCLKNMAKNVNISVSRIFALVYLAVRQLVLMGNWLCPDYG